MPKYNQRESFEALLRGETIVSAVERCKVWLQGDHLMAASPDTGAVWPIYALSLGSDPYIEPNPHPGGTFAWARFENRTKRVMRRIPRAEILAVGGMENRSWHTEAIDATDWVIAL